MTLADSGYKEFSGRLRRIEKAHRKGYGFEAKGTLGRSSTWKRQRSLGKILRAFLVMVLVGWVMKGAIYYYVGETVYEERVAGLATGGAQLAAPAGRHAAGPDDGRQARS